jgi:hypothetical protein
VVTVLRPPLVTAVIYRRYRRTDCCAAAAARGTERGPALGSKRRPAWSRGTQDAEADSAGDWADVCQCLSIVARVTSLAWGPDLSSESGCTE